MTAPGSFVQPTVGKELWFEYLVDASEIIGGIAAVAAFVVGVYMCLDKIKRRAAKKAGRLI